MPTRGLLERRYSDPERSAPYFDARSSNVKSGPQFSHMRHISSSARHGSSDPYRNIRSASGHHQRYEHSPVEIGGEKRQYDLPNKHWTRSRIQGGGRSKSHSRASIDEGRFHMVVPGKANNPYDRC